MYSEQEREQLLAVAKRSIENGLQTQQPLPIDLKQFAAPLVEQRACFVTLEINKQLRGCIGSLQASQALIADVAKNAYLAAFRDPRFPPLTQTEWPNVSLHISILTPAIPLPCDSEADLIAKLRPGIDGLILQDRGARATFLPSVWETLKDPQTFVSRLKQKAGLPLDHWSPTMTAQIYTTEMIS